jgi:hypothetical protein
MEWGYPMEQLLAVVMAFINIIPKGTHFGAGKKLGHDVPINQIQTHLLRVVFCFITLLTLT